MLGGPRQGAPLGRTHAPRIGFKCQWHMSTSTSIAEGERHAGIDTENEVLYRFWPVRCSQECLPQAQRPPALPSPLRISSLSSQASRVSRRMTSTRMRSFFSRTASRSRNRPSAGGALRTACAVRVTKLIDRSSPALIGAGLDRPQYPDSRDHVSQFGGRAFRVLQGDVDQRSYLGHHPDRRLAYGLDDDPGTGFDERHHVQI